MKRLLSTLFSLLLVTSLFAQLTPQQAVAEMGRGTNLGNTLEPPFEGSWNNGPARESYFDAYVEAGFTNIRIPVRWDNHTENSAPFTIQENWMDRVEQVVDWGLDRGLYITLNGHHEDWLKNGYNNQTLKDRYDAMWVQIAERFKDKSEKLLFEIINEPNGMTRSQVDDLNERVLGIIRQTNPTRLVIYGGNMYANAEQLIAAAVPEDDYLIGYYHSYDPWRFSGQSQGTWGTESDYQQLNARFTSVKNWSIANDIPVHYSEFGAMRTCDFNSRMRIYAHYTEQAVVNGFALSVWDDGGDFRMLDRGQNKWPETKDIVVHYYPESPTKITTEIMTESATEEQYVLVSWENRVTDNGEITIERANSSGDFVMIGKVAADATTYEDQNVTVGNTYTYRMHTTRADGTLLHGYPSRVTLSSNVQGPYQGEVQIIAGKVEAEFYDNGGEGVAYHDNDPANQGGNFRPGEGVDIGGNGQNGQILGYVETGEWIEYTVDVAESGSYSVDAFVASEIANGRFSITFSGNGASTVFDTPSTGGWVALETISANSNLNLEKGIQTMRLEIIGSNPFNLDYLTFSFLTNSKDLTESQDQIKVYPNPTADVIELAYDIDALGPLQLRLLDTQGVLVVRKQVTTPTLTLDVSNLAAGNYTLTLGNGTQLITKMFSKI